MMERAASRRAAGEGLSASAYGAQQPEPGQSFATNVRASQGQKGALDLSSTVGADLAFLMKDGFQKQDSVLLSPQARAQPRMRRRMCRFASLRYFDTHSQRRSVRSAGPEGGSGPARGGGGAGCAFSEGESALVGGVLNSRAPRRRCASSPRV